MDAEPANLRERADGIGRRRIRFGSLLAPAHPQPNQETDAGGKKERLVRLRADGFIGPPGNGGRIPLGAGVNSRGAIGSGSRGIGIVFHLSRQYTCPGFVPLYRETRLWPGQAFAQDVPKARPSLPSHWRYATAIRSDRR